MRHGINKQKLSTILRRAELPKRLWNVGATKKILNKGLFILRRKQMVKEHQNASLT